MGLKDLKSNLDLLGGFGNQGGTLGEMDSFNPSNFQKPTDEASQAHIDSLGEVPGGSQNSDYQDLDGLANNPSFGDAGGAGKQLGEVDLHEAMLTKNYTYPSIGTSETTVNASVHDLNGGLPNNGEYLNNLPD